MAIVNAPVATVLPAVRPSSLFASLPNRQDVGIIRRRSTISRAVSSYSQAKVPAGIAAAAVAVATVVAAVLANRQ
jgi:hypothetical protein